MDPVPYLLVKEPEPEDLKVSFCFIIEKIAFMCYLKSTLKRSERYGTKKEEKTEKTF